MVKIVAYNEKQDCEHLLGKFLDDSHYDLLVEEDMDFYDITGDITGETSEKNIIFKFRKGVFSEQQQQDAYDGLFDSTLAESQNRGLASGPRGKTQAGSQGKEESGRQWATAHQIKILKELQSNSLEYDALKIITQEEDKEAAARGQVWVRTPLAELDFISSYDTLWPDFVEHIKQNKDNLEVILESSKRMEKCVSKTSYANPVHSAIVGFFDRYPRYPYARVCNYNQNNPELFEQSFSFFRKLNEEFQNLLPQRHSKQKEAADSIDSRYLVGGDTVFTTVTTNRNFRTAAHRDAGDLTEGFSNLCVVAKEKDWEGGYLVLPEFRVAVNIRPGDLLLINNHEGIHGNTEIRPMDGKSIDEMERISLVSYFREKMLETGEKEYEDIRKEFIESRRLNPDHPNWFPKWNGVTPGVFYTDEWKEFLLSQDRGEEFLQKYHPDLQDEDSLDSLFD